MPRLLKIRNTNVEGAMVCGETLEILANWCNGSVKGTMLPRSQRSIEFWCSYRQMEMNAENGDYIVKLADDLFDVYNRKTFRLLFKDIDDTPY